MDTNLDIRDEIWMVEVGEYGWSRLCRSYEEAVQAAKEHTDWLDEVSRVSTDGHNVRISCNGECYVKYGLKNGVSYTLVD